MHKMELKGLDHREDSNLYRGFLRKLNLKEFSRENGEDSGGQLNDWDVIPDISREGKKLGWAVRQAYVGGKTDQIVFYSRTKKDCMAWLRKHSKPVHYTELRWWDDLIFDGRGCYLSDGVWIK